MENEKPNLHSFRSDYKHSHLVWKIHEMKTNSIFFQHFLFCFTHLEFFFYRCCFWIVGIYVMQLCKWMENGTLFREYGICY